MCTRNRGLPARRGFDIGPGIVFFFVEEIQDFVPKNVLSHTAPAAARWRTAGCVQTPLKTLAGKNGDAFSIYRAVSGALTLKVSLSQLRLLPARHAAHTSKCAEWHGPGLLAREQRHVELVVPDCAARRPGATVRAEGRVPL